MSVEATLPRASREQVLAAVIALQREGPVTIGQIAQYVAKDLGIDTSRLANGDALRKRMSWHGLQTQLKVLAMGGVLVRRTELQWVGVLGAQFIEQAPSPTTAAYCTPSGVETLCARIKGGHMRLLHAEQHAARTLIERHASEYAALVEEWLTAHPDLAAGRAVTREGGTG